MDYDRDPNACMSGNMYTVMIQTKVTYTFNDTGYVGNDISKDVVLYTHLAVDSKDQLTNENIDIAVKEYLSKTTDHLPLRGDFIRIDHRSYPATRFERIDIDTEGYTILNKIPPSHSQPVTQTAVEFVGDHEDEMRYLIKMVGEDQWLMANGDWTKKDDPHALFELFGSRESAQVVVDQLNSTPHPFGVQYEVAVQIPPHLLDDCIEET